MGHPISTGIALGMIGLAGLLAANSANAGYCLSPAPPFALASDTVRWSMVLPPGGECIQGLRYGTMLIDSVVIITPPRGGRLTVQGPSFRYRADPGFRGNDTFTLSISGTNHQLPGSSLVYVDVTVP